MIADTDSTWIVASRRRTGRRHRARSVGVPRAPRGLWDRFWSDHQAIRLKFIILGLCLVAVAVLEVRW